MALTNQQIALQTYMDGVKGALADEFNPPVKQGQSQYVDYQEIKDMLESYRNIPDLLSKAMEKQKEIDEEDTGPRMM